MKATNEKKAEGYSSPYNFEGRIPLSQAIPLGLQIGRASCRERV